jgi:nucleotide-binding universal stress UspA family protein
MRYNYARTSGQQEARVKIVVGYIKSEEGQAALERAIEEAGLRGGHLVVVHSMRGGARDDAEELFSYREELEHVEQRLQGDGISHEIRELVRGKPAGEDLADFAAEEGADLIVIGLRRRSPVGKLVLGSNAQDVLLKADCPVLAVKAS